MRSLARPNQPRLRRWRSAAIVASVMAIGVVLYVGLAVYKAYEYTSTPPQGAFSTTPLEHGITYTDVSFDAADDRSVTLSGWWMQAPTASGAAVLVHGRYQNRTAMLDLAAGLVDRGYSVLVFDLRGHGRSDRSSCFYGLREQHDVIGGVLWLERQGFARESIAVVGWSLGATSVLMAMPELQGLGAVVSDSAFVDDRPLLARNVLRPGLKLAMRLTREVDLARVRPLNDVTMTNIPMLVIHGDADRAVPASHANRLSTTAGDGSRLWVVPGAGHLGAPTIDSNAYISRIDEFLRMHLGGTAN